MHRGLTKNDKKNLRNQCKMGMGLSLLVFVFATIIGVTIYELFIDSDPNGLNIKMTGLIAIGTFSSSVLLNLLICNKYYRDLQFNEKVQVVKTLVNKSKSTIYHASAPGSNISKAYTEKFEFVVEGIKFNVDKELFEYCAEGDQLIFNYAPKSEYLLSVEKK
ncbi:hypothetical protein SLH46_00750 [Draconibacterium sp. IB214405]|uniref:hypothetical protein n=1 Tax=Draconibacterium sp. IB214405 TaxID=3097352 RepID=UPI002A124E59|nr:hypothetical protein [Draconibacterium sp. IB214405]MDX8337689.1 hypothetical protein [Draconibacterium sp. IB214405]